jgi:hypothetical protein
VLDATPKLPDSMLYSNINQLGNFEECVDVIIPTNYGFESKFCRANLFLFTPNGTYDEFSFSGSFTKSLIECQHYLPSITVLVILLVTDKCINYLLFN